MKIGFNGLPLFTQQITIDLNNLSKEGKYVFIILMKNYWLKFL